MTAQLELFKIEARTATFDRQRIYRYELWRRWSPGDRYVQFICLNPSTADETTDDPTTRKCVKFAKTWGFDAMCITNLFAFRATSPQVMMLSPDPVGFGNDRHLLRIAANASLIVCAWSRDGGFNNRAAQVCSLLNNYDLYCLRITQVQPWHPLYLPDSTRPKLWRESTDQNTVSNKGKFDFYY